MPSSCSVHGKFSEKDLHNVNWDVRLTAAYRINSWEELTEDPVSQLRSIALLRANRPGIAWGLASHSPGYTASGILGAVPDPWMTARKVALKHFENLTAEQAALDAVSDSEWKRCAAQMHLNGERHPAAE